MAPRAAGRGAHERRRAGICDLPRDLCAARALHHATSGGAEPSAAGRSGSRCGPSRRSTSRCWSRRCSTLTGILVFQDGIAAPPALVLAAPRLPLLHPVLARLVRRRPALGGQRADLRRGPAHRVPLGGVPDRAADVHPVELRRGGAAVLGRGVFCGWLCPFGALQELTNKAARRLKVPQYRAVRGPRAPVADQNTSCSSACSRCRSGRWRSPSASPRSSRSRPRSC